MATNPFGKFDEPSLRKMQRRMKITRGTTNSFFICFWIFIEDRLLLLSSDFAINKQLLLQNWGFLWKGQSYDPHNLHNDTDIVIQPMK